MNHKMDSKTAIKHLKNIEILILDNHRRIALALAIKALQINQKRRELIHEYRLYDEFPTSRAQAEALEECEETD